MKERKVQTNIKRHQVSRRRTRAWSLSPVIATQLALIMVLAGIGAAFALPSTNLAPLSSAPWAGNATVGSAADLSIANYTLVYNTGLTQVTSITVTVHNGNAANRTGVVDIAINNLGSPATGQEPSFSYPPGNTSKTITLSAPVTIAALDSLNVIVTQAP